MADSLFDNRYRYDFIYPRGRSGETLRAVDTQQQDRPVVIKRPAPSDAPPVRAAQEVSIANERRALARLAGHPALTELVGEGQFVVGGQPHQYIVVERADGVIIADEVLALAGLGRRLPELEMCVVIDRMLDLLVAAHGKDIVYNDVDAKHLFWNRTTYRLKVIDWGNAVFLDGDESNTAGVSKQSDIYQVGEVLYFILTGGGRPDVPRDAADDWLVTFGADDERITPGLRQVISRALHPNPRRRYAYLLELRKHLNEYRAPLERERDSALTRARERLRVSLSKNDLINLEKALDEAALLDPGYPAVRQLLGEVQTRLQSLELSASLDAVRIYLESANWPRAAQMLSELIESAREDWATRIAILLDAASLMQSVLGGHPPSDGIRDALGETLEGRYSAAAYALLTVDSDNSAARKAQWLFAERISAHVPEVQLLRPNLYRLELALAGLGSNGVTLNEVRRTLSEVRATLDAMDAPSDVAHLRDRFREVVDRLSDLQTPLTTLMVKDRLDEQDLPLSALDRAINAAMALADAMHVIGRQVVSSPREARDALQLSRSVDPMNPAWANIDRTLTGLYSQLNTYQNFTPAPDGLDIEAWFKSTQSELEPYRAALFDEALDSIVAGLEVGQTSWREFAEASISGNRAGATEALSATSDSVGMVSPTLSGWLSRLRALVETTRYVERHALSGGLGRTLADGWEAFDRGRLVDSERLGDDAVSIARDETERRAGERLRNLARLAREWVERGGARNLSRTQAALEAVNREFSAQELRARHDFDTQMPSRETYLKAMGRGLLEYYARSSTAAPRLLGFDYLLRATQEAHNTRFDVMDFYREASVRALGEGALRHPMVRSLDEFVDWRKELARLSAIVNAVKGPDAITTIERVRRSLDESPLSKSLAPVGGSLREVEASLHDWGQGEFRNAGGHIENAVRLLSEAETTSGFTASHYRAWLDSLMGGTGELAVQSRTLRQAIDKLPDMPSDVIREAHHKIARISTNLVGESVSAQLVLWRNTYERFLTVYIDKSVRRSVRLERFSELFRAMFVDQHPAYALYRHWYTITESAPEFPPPPTSEPVPQIQDERDIYPIPSVSPPSLDDDTYDEPYTPVNAKPTDRRVGGLMRLLLGVIVLVVLLALIGLVLALTRPADDSASNGLSVAGIELTITDTPDPSVTPTETLAATETVESALPTPETVQTDLPVLAVSPVIEGSTESAVDATPTEEVAPTEAPTLTLTPEPSVSPTATLPAEGLQGDQDLLLLIPQLPAEAVSWRSDQFAPGPDGGYWRLGVGSQTGGDEIRIALDASTLDAAYGNDASLRVRRAEAQMGLSTFDPVLPREQVYFGLMLVPADGSAAVGLKVEAMIEPTTTTLTLYQRIDTTDTFVSQRAANAALGRVRIVRDINAGTVSVFFNDEQIGQPIPFVRGDVAVTPVLFIKDGGVVANVTTWRVGLR